MVERVTDVLARYVAGEIKKEDLDENNQTLLDIFGPGGVMDDDPKFRAKVYARKEELVTNGEKIPLFTSKELQNTLTHKHPIKKKPNHALPEPFWPYVPAGTKRVEIELVADPERNLHKLKNQMNDRFDHHIDTPMNEESKKKINELRNVIGLPVARGNDCHIDDSYYKFLVRHVCNFDTFHIFTEFDRVLTDIPEGLDAKIKLVANLIDELLNKGLSRNEKAQKYDEFIELHREEWNIVDYRRG